MAQLRCRRGIFRKLLIMRAKSRMACWPLAGADRASIDLVDRCEEERAVLPAPSTKLYPTTDVGGRLGASAIYGRRSYRRRPCGEQWHSLDSGIIEKCSK